MTLISDYLVALWNLTTEMAPYLLLGLAIAGVLHVYVKKEIIQKYLGAKSIKSVIYAAIIGVPLPLCSCGVIPTGVGFRREGASKGATVSFLISTPQTGIDSILVTYSMMGWPFALLRPIIAFITGIAGGIATNFADKSVAEVTPPPIKDQCEGDSCCAVPTPSNNTFIDALHYAFVEFLEDIGSWLVIGLVLAAGISVAIPDSFFDGYFGYSITGMLIILAASVPLYVCATGSVPIAAMLLLKGLSPGTALVFLMAGPATNVATITVLSKTLGKKATVIYVATIVFGALGFGLFIDLLLPAEWFTQVVSSSAHIHEHGMVWWKLVSGIVLTALLVYALLNKYVLSRFSKQTVHTKVKETPVASTVQKPTFTAPINFASIGMMQQKTIIIHGMTCNHCKSSVEKNLLNLPGITSVDVNLAQKTALISGSNIVLAQVEAIVNDIGYNYKGEALKA